MYYYILQINWVFLTKKKSDADNISRCPATVGRYTCRQKRGWGEFEMYAVEIGLGSVIYTPGFIHIRVF
jgi:hypothetical protein